MIKMRKFLKSKEFKKLKKYLEKEKSVVLAFLFGSFALEREMEESDLDIGVYLKNEKLEDKIWHKVSEITQKNVQLVVLNKAPASLISNAFENGIPLTIKDKKLYWEVYLRASKETEDFLEFLKDFQKIKKQAKSLTKAEESRLRVRIDYLKTQMSEISRFQKLTFKEYTREIDKRRIVERWTENIINATIDIAKMVLASEKKEAPRSYEEALLHFGFLIGLNEKESEKFSKFANLRNILAHEYLDILYGRIQEFIKEFPKFYKKISDFLEKYLRKWEI